MGMLEIEGDEVGFCFLMMGKASKTGGLQNQVEDDQPKLNQKQRNTKRREKKRLYQLLSSPNQVEVSKERLKPLQIKMPKICLRTLSLLPLLLASNRLSSPFLCSFMIRSH
ncbi:unnamed protein product [Camellia sinensis]